MEDKVHSLTFKYLPNGLFIKLIPFCQKNKFLGVDRPQATQNKGTTM